MTLKRYFWKRERHDISTNDNENRIDVYNAIALPARNVRYNKLFDLFKQIADFNQNGRCYKLAYMGLSSCLAHVKSVQTSSCTTSKQAPIPLNSKGKSQYVNQSLWKQQKTQAEGATDLLSQRARQCRKCGGHGHRADNSQCPASSSIEEETKSTVTSSIE